MLANISLSVTDVLSLTAIFISLFVLFRDMWRYRSAIKVSGPNKYHELSACYFAPAIDPQNGNVSSFMIELLLENRSASPESITTIELVSKNYSFKLPAAFDTSSYSYQVAFENIEGTFMWDTKGSTSLPILLKPYQAQKVKILFPVASDNYNPFDEEPHMMVETPYIPYTLYINKSRGRPAKISGLAYVGRISESTKEPHPHVDALG